MPAELGSARGTGPSVRTEPTTEEPSLEGSGSETQEERPPIEQWLACWADGRRF